MTDAMKVFLKDLASRPSLSQHRATF